MSSVQSPDSDLTIVPPHVLRLFLPEDVFPASRGELIGRACRARAPEDLIAALRRLPRNDEPYWSLDDVRVALGPVS